MSASFNSSARSGSKQEFAVSVPSSRSTSSASSCKIHDFAGAGDWSGSEGSFSGYESSDYIASSVVSERHILGPKQGLDAIKQDSSLPNSTSWCDYPAAGTEATVNQDSLFEPAYSLVPSASVGSESQIGQTLPLVSPLEEVNPFEFPLDPVLALGERELNYMEEPEMDLQLPIGEEAFHVEDWSRYMWSAETGFEHLDTVLLSLGR